MPRLVTCHITLCCADQYALVLHTWICTFAYFDTCTLQRSSAPFGFLQHLYVLKLQNVLHTSPPSPNIPSHVHTSHIGTSPNIWQSSTHALHVARTSHICRHTSLHISSYSRYTISHLHTSSCTKAHRIFVTPSETFGHQFSWFLSIPNTLVHISKYFCCARPHICASSGLHSSPSIQHLSPIHENLALTSDQMSSTAIPHLHSLK